MYLLLKLDQSTNVVIAIARSVCVIHIYITASHLSSGPHWLEKITLWAAVSILHKSLWWVVGHRSWLHICHVGYTNKTTLSLTAGSFSFSLALVGTFLMSNGCSCSLAAPQQPFFWKHADKSRANIQVKLCLCVIVSNTLSASWSIWLVPVICDYGALPPIYHKNLLLLWLEKQMISQNAKCILNAHTEPEHSKKLEELGNFSERSNYNKWKNQQFSEWINLIKQ